MTFEDIPLEYFAPRWGSMDAQPKCVFAVDAAKTVACNRIILEEAY